LGASSTYPVLIKKKKVNALLDTSPLKTLIKGNISFGQIQKNIDSGMIKALAIKALNYSTGIGKTFFQGHDALLGWERSGRKGEREHITVDHLVASSAIPILFPPVKIGKYYYGDGSLRNHTPFSPAIKLGAEKLFIIGVKQANYSPSIQYPSLARIVGLTLNSVLLDAIDQDYERLERISEIAALVDKKKGFYLKPIKTCIIRPSEDIGKIASTFISDLPATLQHLIKGLGNQQQASELISYLLFESRFTNRLIDLGYKDALNQTKEINQFLKN